jgi:hypothetical protein
MVLIDWTPIIHKALSDIILEKNGQNKKVSFSTLLRLLLAHLFERFCFLTNPLQLLLLDQRFILLCFT